MADGADGLVIEGYVTCRCGEWMAELSVEGKRKLCDSCLAVASNRLEAAQFTYEVEGRTFDAYTRRKAQKNRSAKPGTPWTRNRTRALQVAGARNRAVARLIRIYRPMFDLLIADERAKVGLPPARVTRGVRPVALAKAIVDDLQAAEEREARQREQRLVESRDVG